MALTLYRLAMGDPLHFDEQVGDPITNQGGAPVPAIRAALRHQLGISTLQAAALNEDPTHRLRTRRQLRSLLNNTPFKLTGYFLSWDADGESEGWYVPDQGSMVDYSGQGEGLATGLFKIEGVSFVLAGRPRTHRRAMWAYIKDLRTALWARDYRRVIFSTDYAALTALRLSYFPPNVTDLVATGSGTVSSTVPQTAGMEGQGSVAVELLDLARVSYEQPETARNRGQVVAYDRRGEATEPPVKPGNAWEEFYGPDWPYSWLGASPINDTPALDNGICRVLYDSTGIPGWRVYVSDGTEWKEQCKVILWRKSTEGTLYDTELVSASLVEYTETRAVIQAVMRVPSIPNSREEIYITLQRGWTGPRFEAYPGAEAGGLQADAYFEVDLSAAGETDISAMKIDASSKGAIEATAKGTGHTGNWPGGGALVGAAYMEGENELMIARWGTPWSLAIATVARLQNVVVIGVGPAYGSSRNAVQMQNEGRQGYASIQLGFVPQQANQALEAESMTLGAGTASTVDAEGSNGKTATATRTTDANAHVTKTAWPGRAGTYRVFARVKTSTGASKVKIYAKTTSTTGATKESASTTLAWVDLGDIVSTNGTLEIHAWLSAAGTVSVDRIEAFLMEDRASGVGAYSGGRDLGQSCLYDSRMIPTIVTRSA